MKQEPYFFLLITNSVIKKTFFKQRKCFVWQTNWGGGGSRAEHTEGHSCFLRQGMVSRIQNGQLRWSSVHFQKMDCAGLCPEREVTIHVRLQDKKVFRSQIGIELYARGTRSFIFNYSLRLWPLLFRGRSPARRPLARRRGVHPWALGASAQKAAVHLWASSILHSRLDFWLCATHLIHKV